MSELPIDTLIQQVSALIRQQTDYINNINNERARLTAELARYKQEAEKIPGMCCHNPNCSVEECPQICPKYKGGGQDGNTTGNTP